VALAAPEIPAAGREIELCYPVAVRRPGADILSSDSSRLQSPQWSLVVREVRRVQHLNAGIVLAIEWRHRLWAAGVLGVCRRVEPEAQMVGLHGVSCRIPSGIGEWRIVEDEGCRSNSGGDDECLDAEASPEVLHSVAVVVCLEVSLIPRQSERSLGTWITKKLKSVLGGKPGAEMNMSSAAPDDD
jgi:hypothetical protein